jgi:4'-phosphopantetheinyl transferase EntD
MIERLLPAGVAHAEAFEDVPESTLFPDEVAILTRAVPKRRREFTTVRHCARQALGRLGFPPVPLLSARSGAPRWPDGVVGSMTHCDGYRAAVVARSDRVQAIGLDAEPHTPLPPRVLHMIARSEEVAMLAQRQCADGSVCWDRLLFCAKEAVYKAWFPLALRRLGFSDASVTLAVDGTLVARLLVDGPVTAGEKLTGHWIHRWYGRPPQL